MQSDTEAASSDSSQDDEAKNRQSGEDDQQSNVVTASINELTGKLVVIYLLSY